MGRMFEKRKTTMFARWDRMAKAFTRVSKEITIAVKAGGGNPDHNPALRRAIQNARAVNMPKDRVENAIKKAEGNDAEDYQELIYEGYAPHGVPIVVETATDNPTRTVANVRHHFSKLGGNLGSTGSVTYMFDRHGVFRIKTEGVDRDELELDLIDHGLIELEEGESDKGEALFILRCDFTDFGNLQSALETREIEPISSESEYVAQTLIELGEAETDEVLALVDRLEQDDDVQKVAHALA
ncbi:MAG: YebC/PmpR family DNA-binding transcriptional regulator [Deltaproteobacteria bacterium]|nr:MAG: YebC/PmpR family DNA-binding transcriptional regulator [Deltaproteobacteria bacterium]